VKARAIFYAVLVAGLMSLLGFAYVLQNYSTARPQGTAGPGVTFVFTDLDGNPVNITSFRGKVVLLDAMASWCVPCFEEVRHLREVTQLYPKDVVVISMTVDPHDTLSNLKLYRENNNVTWTMVQFQPTVVATIRSTDIPSLVIYDRQGVDRARFNGLTDVATISAAITEVINSY